MRTIVPILPGSCTPSSTKTKLFNKCLVICDEQIKELTSVCKNTPVEETQIGVTIEDAEDINNINKYTEYITDSIKIFGSFEVMSYAKNGNPICNISATQICYDIAKQNGWSETLDMNIPFNVQIDACYNPNVLREGVVLRDPTNDFSFKNVSREYLLKHNG